MAASLDTPSVPLGIARRTADGRSPASNRITASAMSDGNAAAMRDRITVASAATPPVLAARCTMDVSVASPRGKE